MSNCKHFPEADDHGLVCAAEDAARASALKATTGRFSYHADHPQNACGHVYDEHGHEVATLYGSTDDATRDADGVYVPQPIRDAHGKLLAAAPDMFKALQGLLETETVETEYDGRTYDVCKDCGSLVSENQPHKIGCHVVLGKAAIADAKGGA